MFYMINLESSYLSNKVEILVEIFKKRANIDFGVYNNLKNEKLLGSKICMPVREMVLALYDIEKELAINIPNEIILSGKFDTFNSICRIIDELYDSINFN